MRQTMPGTTRPTDTAQRPFDGRVQADPIQAPGTSESDWQTCPTLTELPAHPLTDVTSVVVFAAHPDDETLGVGGTLAMLAAAGVRLRIVMATEGEGSHPRSDAVTQRRLARIRRQEDLDSLSRLGIDGRAVIRLGLPDSGLADHEGELVKIAERMVEGFDLCLAPWSGDLHPDHEAVGRAAARAARTSGVSVCHFPVWMWHWAGPSDRRVPWERAARIDLSASAMNAKAEAIACHRSQILPLGPNAEDAPILPADELAHFKRPYEVVFK
jgi:LmbE family N-acetylglucosaminyl deacetylase